MAQHTTEDQHTFEGANSSQPARLIQHCVEDVAFQQRIDPVLLEGWRNFARDARQQQKDARARLCSALVAQKRAAICTAVLAAVVLGAGVILSVILRPRGGELLVSMSTVHGWLLSRYGFAVVGVLVACFLLARHESSVRRARDYENTLAFMSTINVALSAAITLKRGAAIDRSIDALVKSQRHGLLSASATGAAGRAARWRRNVELVASLIRPFVK